MTRLLEQEVVQRSFLGSGSLWYINDVWFQRDGREEEQQQKQQIQTIKQMLHQSKNSKAQLHIVYLTSLQILSGSEGNERNIIAR